MRRKWSCPYLVSLACDHTKLSVVLSRLWNGGLKVLSALFGLSGFARHGVLAAVTSVETVACKGRSICLSPVRRDGSSLGLLYDLCPGVFERYGSVEDEFVRC